MEFRNLELHELLLFLQNYSAIFRSLQENLFAGSNWHTRIRCEQNHFIYSDVPQFIMDTYEDCRRPPCLHLLDKYGQLLKICILIPLLGHANKSCAFLFRFDPGGPGSCLKRYSDPTFFKRASVASGEASMGKISKDKKGRKIKVIHLKTFHKTHELL